MDKPYRAQLDVVYSGKFNVPKSRYDVLIRQRHFQLLGRSLDLNNLISQRQNTYLRQNVEYAINRFEGSDLTSIIELENQLLNIQLVHKMMSQYFSLDPWNTISLSIIASLFFPWRNLTLLAKLMRVPLWHPSTAVLSSISSSSWCPISYRTTITTA